ncbi:MAG TPA: LUD domain-containing protein, partial [Rhizomicrobium sp.]|nr:LUD domain-containing protein [Rhizomicrobium sp.]
MSARDEILEGIRLRARARTKRPDAYRAPSGAADLVASFIEKAQAVNTDIRVLDREDEIPAAVAELLRARNLAARIHLPPESDLAGTDWQLDVVRTPPGPDDTAVTRAPFAIAETGTLVQTARAGSPASWHFRPGFEIAILSAHDIVAHFEDLKLGTLPATVNLITG